MPTVTAQSALAVARYFLERGALDGTPDLTPLKLIKLVYIAHGWALHFADAPLLSEPVEAWRDGPMVPSLYHRLARFGNRTIACDQVGALPRLVDPDDMTKAVLDGVWAAYKDFSALQLSTLTHSQGSPWDAIRQERGQVPDGVTIRNDQLRDYYATLADSLAETVEEAGVGRS